MMALSDGGSSLPPECDTGAEVQRTLQRIARLWSSRAQVKQDFAFDEHRFDLARPDFLTSLLPFQNHPRFLKFDDEEVQMTLTSAWLGYNAKTLEIENQIVSPLCFDILGGHFPGVLDRLSHQLVAETMVDESYHVLLTINACAITRAMRQASVVMPTSLLIRKMKTFEATFAEQWQRDLVRFATCVVSEIFISQHLLLLSQSKVVQPLHRLVVDTHRKDEIVHKSIFRQFAKQVYGALSQRQKEFFALVLPRPVRWFAAQDLASWSSIFQQLNISNVRELIEDCQSLHGNRVDVDYSGVIELARELGITDSAAGRDAFEEEGLTL